METKTTETKTTETKKENKKEKTVEVTFRGLIQIISVEEFENLQKGIVTFKEMFE